MLRPQHLAASTGLAVPEAQRGQGAGGQREETTGPMEMEAQREKDRKTTGNKMAAREEEPEGRRMNTGGERGS